MLDGKRVVIVLGSLELGGSERQAVLLARHLTRGQGADVQVWGFDTPGRTAELCEEYGVPWRLMPTPWSSSLTRRSKRLVKFVDALRRTHPDVILPYTLAPNVICGLAWRWAGARLCIWNQRDEGLGYMGQRSQRWAVRQTPWFVCNSQQGMGYLVQQLGVQPSRVRVIHNGIELTSPEADRVTWRNRIEVREDCFLACMVANLTVHKDHITLLKAWRKVVDQLKAGGRQAVLLLAGRSDNTLESLKALAYDLELGKRVRFLGKVNDVSGLLGAVDLGVFSSRSEGCPNGILECMAAGLAVVGTDVPGIREAVGPEGYAFLAMPGDAQGFADQILELAADAELRVKLGAANCQRIRTEFSPQRMCEETVELVVDGLSR